MGALQIAFEAPDMGAITTPSRERPIDLVHLATQTMGNKDLETEILHLFSRQANQSMIEISNCDGEDRSAAAHRLASAALGVGAFEIAECAKRIESDPDSAPDAALLITSIVSAQNFIQGILR